MRVFIYILSTAAITLVYALRLAFHSTILCQYDRNDTESYLADANLRGWQYSSVSIGLFLGLLPLSALHRFGTRNVISLYGVIGCVSCFLYPWSHGLGFWPSFIIRTIQGMPGAILLWAVNNVPMEWAPAGEVSTAIAILSCVYQIAPFIAMLTAGEMCVGWGWEYTYYVLGAVTTLVFLAFFFLYTNSPRKNRFTSEKEAEYIMDGKSKTKVHHNPVPYVAALTDPQVYLVWYMYFAFFTGTYIFLQYGPTYINQVLKFNVRKTGWWSAAPYVVSILLKFGYGSLLDKLSCLSPRRKLVGSFAIIETFCALLLGMLIFTDSKDMALSVYLLFNSLHGLVIVVIMKQVQTIARQHAHFLANGNTAIVAICIFFTPMAINLFVPDNTPEQWSTLFAGIAVLIISSVVLFSFFAASTPRKWTEADLIPRDAVALK